MEEEIVFRRWGDVTINGVAYAKNLVNWMLENSDSDRGGYWFPLISAKTFTATMFEGAIHEIGQIICKDWNKQRNKRKPISFQSIYIKHKFVRRCLGLANDNSDTHHNEIRSKIFEIFEFRDSFAHPRVLTTPFEEYITETATSIKPVLWQEKIDRSDIKKDFEQIENYCEILLKLACAKLKPLNDALKKPHLSDEWLKARKDKDDQYPLLSFDLQEEIYRLEGLLKISEMASHTTTKT